MSHRKAQPGQQVTVRVRSRPSAFVGLMAVDKSVKLLKSGNDITQDLVKKLFLENTARQRYETELYTDPASIYTRLEVQSRPQITLYSRSSAFQKRGGTGCVFRDPGTRKNAARSRSALLSTLRRIRMEGREGKK
ncbi:MAG: hypothetical protein GY696_18415 [Gammaproteobacteria bacterium]|nr:hypothetical protein [Gammaproteobacteria bacterium]